MQNDKTNDALKAKEKYQSAVESAYDYVEHFDLLETITNVGNDEVFTPRKTVEMMLDSLPDEVWHNPNYKWLNPATKNGVFEREIAIRLNEGLKDIIPDEETRKKHILQKMIYSFGQTKFTANVARRTLYYCCEANRKCDGIRDEKDGHYVNGYAIGNGTWFDDKEGNIKTPTADHDFIGPKGKEKCKFCGISKDSRYVDPLQREQYAYEFIHHNASDLRYKIKNVFLKGDNAMKFDIIIGNPPYQLNDGGGTGSSSRPIYNLFVEKAKELNPKYLSMIIPSRWYSGGKGLDDFRESMLKDKHIKQLDDFDNFREVFPTVDLAGGACFFVRDSSYNGDCKVINHSKSNNTMTRALDKYEFFIRSNESVKIVDKIVGNNKKFLSERVSVRLPFGIPTTYKPKEDGIPCHFTQKIGVQPVDPKDVSDNLNALNKWKFLIPKAPIAGQTDFSRPVGFYYDGNTRIAKPNECCSESWLIAGMFDTKEETEYYKSYILTKTVRFLLLQTVVSQNITRKNYCFVPDLMKYDKIYTDDYLRKIWNITDEEWLLIDSRIGNIGDKNVDFNIDIEAGDDDE